MSTKRFDRDEGEPEPGHSVSRDDGPSQPDNATEVPVGPKQSPGPPLHVVLFQPEIPQNTGNIGRTCVALGAKLWIVEPMAFEIDEKRVRRAGLDYWKFLDLERVDDWSALTERLAGHRFFFLSRFAKKHVWDAQFRSGDVLVFGRETSGLPASILNPDDPRSLKLPTSQHVRSLNLATTAGIVMYEHQRQTRHQP